MGLSRDFAHLPTGARFRPQIRTSRTKMRPAPSAQPGPDVFGDRKNLMYSPEAKHCHEMLPVGEFNY